MLPRRRALLGIAAAATLGCGNAAGSRVAGQPAAQRPPGTQKRHLAESRERPDQGPPHARVLVLGATGFIGTRVVHALEAQGVEIAAASRRGEGPHGVALDRKDTDRVHALVRERRPNTVIDLLAYTEVDTLPLLAALDGKVERWVMASSCDVYRNYEGLHRRATPAPIAEPLAEHAPLRSTRYPYRGNPRRDPAEVDAFLDDYDKIPLENALRSRGSLSSVVLRLPMVYGPGDRQRRFRSIVEPMLAEKNRLVVDHDWARWRTSYGYVDDVADAIATAALHPATPGRTFNLGEADTPDHRGWIDRFADSLGWNGAVIEEIGSGLNPLAGLDLSYPLATDTRAFRAACGWREPTAVAEALARTAADEKRRG